jgi:hypothetical protein
MRLGLLASAVLLAGAAAGCRDAPRPSPPSPAIPAASDVKEARLQCPGSGGKGRHDVTLTRQADIAALVEWLQGVDWSPSKAHDLTGVGLGETGAITVTRKDGGTLAFGLSAGRVILGGAGGRWEWPADTDRLGEIAKQAGAKAP